MYSWYDDEWDFEGVIASGMDTLDKKGTIAISQKLAHEDVTRTMLLTLEGTVTAPNRQTLSGRTNCLVHNGEFYIGIRPTKTFVDVKTPIDFEFITTSPDGDIISGKDVKIEIIRREWVSVRKAGVEGRYEWISEMHDSTVHTMKVKTQDQTVMKSYTPDNTGYYIIKALAKDGKGSPLSAISNGKSIGPELGFGHVLGAFHDDQATRIEFLSLIGRPSAGAV